MSMVQYGVWPNCCNSCKFCLRLNRDTWNTNKMIKRLHQIRENIKTIDWKKDFPDGISLLGGELYYITDKKLQNEFMLLIDDIITYVLKDNPSCKYSTVTNGLYDPTFLFQVLDKIIETVGLDRVDINFSYDLKYRFASEEKRQQCIRNANELIKRYNYKLSVQMILTQYVIDEIMGGRFDIDDFENNVIPGCMISFLYPHPINPKLPPISDFNFTKKSFIRFIAWLMKTHRQHFDNLVSSIFHSGVFKYTGVRDVAGKSNQKPVLSDGKEKINPKCGHSRLYQCYTDTDDCIYCDLKKVIY